MYEVPTEVGILGADQKERGLWGRVNKLTSVFYASVLLLIMNFVITLSK